LVLDFAAEGIGKVSTLCVL